jgi:acetylornithine deacetylase/succinyl-diaminopimelate desuccinylase-like protein
MPGKGQPFRSSPNSKIAQVGAHAYEEVFGKPCARILLGGSIPIASDLAKTAGAEMIFIGVGLATDQIHAPNEHFDMERFEQGYLTICRCIDLLSQKG